MDARTALLSSAGAAIVIAVGVTCGVALTSANALANRRAMPIADAAIVVQGHAGTATASSGPADGEAETVPAPAPKDIAAPKDTAPAAPKTTTPQQRPSAGGANGVKTAEAAAPAKETATGTDSRAHTSIGEKAAVPPLVGEKDTTAGRAKALESAARDAAEKVRDRLRALVERWSAQQESQRTGRTTFSVGETDIDSGSRYPRPRSGSEEGQSQRSPDDSDW